MLLTPASAHLQTTSPRRSFPAVRHAHADRVDKARAVPGQIPPLDFDHVGGLERRARPTLANEAGSAGKLELPVGNGAGLDPSSIRVKTHMRVLPFDFGDAAHERDRLLRVVLGRERVVRQCVRFADQAEGDQPRSLL